METRKEIDELKAEVARLKIQLAALQLDLARVIREQGQPYKWPYHPDVAPQPWYRPNDYPWYQPPQYKPLEVWCRT